MLVVDEERSIAVKNENIDFIRVAKKKDGNYCLLVSFQYGWLELGDYYTEEFAQKVFKDITNGNSEKYIIPVQEITTIQKWKNFERERRNEENGND